MTIQEKALKLAEYDGYNKKCHISESIKELQKDCIKEYTSFDKLMELFEKANKTGNDYYININSQGIELYTWVSRKKEIIDIVCYATSYPLKEALIDCLLKYYELTKGD